VTVKNSTNIDKTKESLISDGQEFHQYPSYNAIFIGPIFSLANNICHRIHNYHVVLVWVSCHIEFLISNPLYWLHYALPSKTQFAIINSPIDAQTLQIQYSYFLNNHICKYAKGINIIRIFIFFNLLPVVLLNYRFLKLWNITHESLLLQFLANEKIGPMKIALNW
jgi:hypothetical protein